MTCVAPVFILVAVLIIVAGLSQRGPTPTPSVLAAYQLVAQRFRGQCQRAGWSRWPVLRFPYRDAAVQVQVRRAPELNRWWVTEVRLSGPDTGFHCEVTYPPGGAIPRREPLRDTPLGVPEFDRGYRLRAAGPLPAAQLLTPTVCWHIDRLRRLGGEPLHAEFARGTVSVQKARLLTRYEELLQYIELVLELYDQVLLTRPQGVEFVDDEQAQPVENALCKVCGEPIGADLVFCRRCKTPHHRDCWNYTGQCSVFGCGETQCDIPRVAAPGDPEA
jgi:hypothetical protein